MSMLLNLKLYILIPFLLAASVRLFAHAGGEDGRNYETVQNSSINDNSASTNTAVLSRTSISNCNCCINEVCHKLGGICHCREKELEKENKCKIHCGHDVAENPPLINPGYNSQNSIYSFSNIGVSIPSEQTSLKIQTTPQRTSLTTPSYISNRALLI